ncbi:CFEM domain-containing protein [Hirsutella rhossiliensis]|uniref:CFEM domain-containing protein n=1 Tax=Hirsutella rhossiliensis TaxID=111463 RepID=A0A9P8MV29_9HYPO|nr:CFEM domain-containing protein [Hirsutella rhossiliensis]KAH0961795.1 CFEM domain-containing protein [Hirsutella rhossiliensis]
MHYVVLGAKCDVGDGARLSACLCENTSLLNDISICVQKSCTFSDLLDLIRIKADLCADYSLPSRSTSIVMAAGVSIAITVPVVALRIVWRLASVGSLWWDDWTAVLSGVFMVVTNTIALTSAKLGFGMHIWDLNPRFVLVLRQLFWIGEIGYLPGLSLLKVSILLLYGRIFQTEKFLKMVRYGTIFLVAKTIAFTFPAAFQCIPPSAAWSHDPHATCINAAAFGYAWSGMSIVEDLLLIALPIPTLWNLQMSRSRCICVTGLLSIGSLTFVASIVRAKYIIILAETLDTTWDMVDIIVWTLIELLAAAICSSVLPCRTCPTRVFSLVRSYVTNSHSGTEFEQVAAHDSKRPSAARIYHQSNSVARVVQV